MEGDYFEYQLKEKTTIGKNQSALVPILAARVEAEKVSLWNESDRISLRALWLTNTSGLTVDAGTFNVLTLTRLPAKVSSIPCIRTNGDWFPTPPTQRCM